MTTEATRKFHFLREIASGGFGSVYLAKVIHGDGFSRLAAIKLLHSKWTENEEIAKRMRDEARLLGWLRHKHIVDVIDLTVIDGRCAVIMEYLEAVDVKVVVNACIEHKARIPLRVCLEICASVASALDAAYNRPPFAGEKPLHVIHRDIKPSNVMVDEGGTTKVLDFGVARAEFDTREAKTQELSFGSIDYMPPERLFFEPESPASDVYSLGASLFEMVALEKLGKAKLRPTEQERFVEDRFDDLLERHPMPSEEIEDILHDLLFDMVAFNEVDRPTAADCVTRMRSFARRLDHDETLDEWSEAVIPPLLRQQQRRGEADAAEDKLVDQVLTEDTAGFKPGPGKETWAPSPLEAPPRAELPSPNREDPADPPLAPQGLGNTPRPIRAGGASSPPPIPEALRPRSATPIPPPGVPGRPYDDEVAPTVLVEVNRTSSTDETTSSPSIVKDLSSAAELPATSGLDPTPAPAARHGSGIDEDEEETAVSSTGGGLMGWVALVAAAGLAGFVVFFVGAVVVAGVSLFLFGGESTVPDGVPTETVAAPNPAPVAEPVHAVQPGEGAHFVSDLPGTRKVSVRCDGGKSDGGSEASVEGTALGTCTVTAVDSKRNRQTAVVSNTELRTYRCFGGQGAGCE